MTRKTLRAFSAPRAFAWSSSRPLLAFGAAAALLLPSIARPAAGSQEPGESPTEAPTVTVGGGTIPVQVIDGRLVVSCDLSTVARRIPVNLFLEIEGRHGLQLHNRAAAGLRAETPDGQPRAITMHFPDFDVTVPARELGDEELFEEFTKYHSIEMGENALVGSIGVEVLKDWTVTLDVGNGAIRLVPPTGGGAPPAAARVEQDGTIVAPLSIIDDMIWLPARWSDGTPGGLMLGTGVYDTRIEERAAIERGHPAGDVGPIRIGNVDLHEYVAFRPEPVVQVHPDGVVGITGLGLLESLELTVNRSTRELRLKTTGEPNFPEADLEFFRARANEDPDALLAFLEAHGGRPESDDDVGSEPTRLAHEAARLLLDYRLEDMASPEDVDTAVTWIYDTMAGDLRTTRMLDLMKEMSDAGETAVVVKAGKLGIDSGRDDRYPNAVHEVHGLLGRTLMDQGEEEDAWRHLLSAAFGLPEDGRINYDLGRFYENQGRLRRAYSRYVQAVIKPEAGGLAIEALQRVQPKLFEEGDSDAGAETFSVDTIERMIAGKVRNFGAASKFVPTDEQPSNRIVLAEFFTNGHLGNEERGGAIGGALGFEGLISHFSDEQMAFLEYHLPTPEPDALCTSIAQTRADALGVENPTVIILDGQQGSPGAGKWRDAEAIYNRARNAVIPRMANFGDFEVMLDAKVEDGEVSGVATLYGFDDPGLRLHVVLAEKGVLYPGTSGVIIHRYVARGSLVSNDEGIEVSLEEDAPEYEFKRSLQSIESAHEEYLEQLESEGVGTAPRISMTIDPNQVRVIAFLTKEGSGAVLAAAMVTPEGVLSEDSAVTVPGESQDR